MNLPVQLDSRQPIRIPGHYWMNGERIDDPSLEMVVMPAYLLDGPTVVHRLVESGEVTSRLHAEFLWHDVIRPALGLPILDHPGEIHELRVDDDGHTYRRNIAGLVLESDEGWERTDG